MPNRQPSLPLLLKLHDSISEIISVIDAEGRFVYINQACFPIWGYQPAELIGVRCFDLMVPEDEKRSAEAVAAAHNGADIKTYENRYYRKNGDIALMFWEGEWNVDDQLMYCTGRDITEQRRMEEVEKAYHKELQRINEHLERITDGFVGLDEDARITYWNKAAEAIYKLPREEVLGKVLWDLMAEPVKTNFLQRYQEMKDKRVPVTFELYSLRTECWLEFTSYMSESGMSVYFRDITLMRQMHEKLKEQKEIEQQRTTAAVIKAAEEERAIVGKELHDNVNQVLTTVKLYTELCMSDIDIKDELLKKSALLIQESINEIRALSKRLSAPSLGNIRLAESVKELTDAINTTRRIQVTYENDVEALDVSEDLHVGVYRILQEQFTNILKHSKATAAHLKITLEENTFHLSLQDNGQGFDPSRVKRGIGLDNMNSRAEVLKGKCNLKSAPGKGCLLELTLPLQ